jgi:hypothetical protein
MSDTVSLASAVDRVNEAHFWGVALAVEERDALARWIASRQGAPRAYHGCLFAPTEADAVGEVRTFTGEQLRSDVGRRHVLGEEAARALWLLAAPIPEAQGAAARASDGMAAWFSKGEAATRAAGQFGLYCCGTCTASLWRHMTAGGLGAIAHCLPDGIAQLRSLRMGDGAWRRFPFWYTVSALQEMELPEAVEELRYAAARLSRAARRQGSGDRYAARRLALAQRVLARVS